MTGTGMTGADMAGAGVTGAGGVTGGRAVVVPSAPALLPRYAALSDPLAEVRAAAVAAVAWLAEQEGTVAVVAADDLGRRVADHLLEVAAPGTETQDLNLSGNLSGNLGEGLGEDLSGHVPARLLVVADGSARRGEKAPGHLDPRAHGFDATIGEALRRGDPAALAVLDQDLGAQLLAGGVPAFRALGALLGDRRVQTGVDYDADPFGVQYWVVRWQW